MAILLTPGMKIKVTQACNAGFQYGLMTIKYNVVSVFGTAMTDQKLIDALATEWSALLKAIMPPTASYYGAKLDHLAGLAPAPVTSFNGSGAGTVGTDLTAPAAALLIGKQTAKAGRKWRGRLYLPFIAADLLNSAGGPIVATVNPLMTAIGNKLSADVTYTSGGDSAVIRAIVTGSTIPVTAFEPVTATYNRNQLATQRRRSKINKGDAFPF